MQLGYPVIKTDEPFLKTSFAYDPAYRQPGFNVEAANKLLDEAGWPKNADGRRFKDKTELAVKLLGQNNYENGIISKNLQLAWLAVGVKVEVVLKDDQDLQESISARSYDVLLNAVSLGLDPDAYAFWHSSQADKRSLSRLNFSDYVSATADKSLDSGRTRVDQQLRSAKYKPFLQAWKDDSPALALFQPRFLYVTRGELFYYNPETVNSSVDRLNNVHNWMIRQANTPIN
jgi:peptide/nickel transport system substrate-binding protein